jgi:hypothetical protein
MGHPERAGPVGGGWLHEAGGADVVLIRVTGGREAADWHLHGNVLLQKPFVEGRDAFDVITSTGWAWKFGQSVSIGAEGVGEDLEGFWNPAEAEGGSGLLVGPSLHLAPPGRSWQLSVVGGPTFHPTNSYRSNDALRDLPTCGYGIKVSFSATS